MTELLSSVKLYDTRNRKFFLVDSTKPLKIYVCGPTVYTHTHIGHLKTYMTFDIMRSVLEGYFKIPVQFMMNITNVDDKIIKGTYQKEYGENIDLNTLEENQILENQKFIDYADYWERDFFEIMNQMGIKRPNIVSRVTEYIDEILEFVDKIYEKGFAFEDNGSVYFYGTKYNNILNDAGEFSKDPEDPENFVLLKKARRYEPGWSSKWGLIRPGWHIECSAMASSVFSEHFDIHGGGIDLEFPHHHNEIQQSNSRFYDKSSIDQGGQEWVDHFMHTGHLNIEGLKMSRSLKNFITVAEIAKEYSPDQLRMLFMIHQWADTMDYSKKTMKHAIYYVESLTNFFMQMSNVLLRPTTKNFKKFGSIEIDFSKYFESIKLQIDQELRNNLNTPNVIKALMNLSSSLFTYVKNAEMDGFVDGQLVRDVVDYTRSLLIIFGFDLGLNNKSDDKEQKLLKVISDIRTEMRESAKEMSNKLKPVDKSLAKEIPQSLYKLTDKIRDVMLPEIGIQLTDK